MALALVLSVPAPGRAQDDSLLGTPRVSITPLGGYRFDYSAMGEFTVRTPDSLIVDAFDVDERHTGAEMLGVRLDVHLAGPLGLVGEVAYSQPGELEVVLESEGAADQSTTRRGSELWLYKAGLSVRVPDPADVSNILVTVAPALLRESRDAWPYAPGGEAGNHYALDLGLDAVVPLGTPWLGLLVGAEDLIVFWDREPRERTQEEALLNQPGGGPTLVEFAYDTSHLFMLRAGISLRFF